MDCAVTQYPYNVEIPLNQETHITPQFGSLSSENLNCRALLKLQSVVDVRPGERSSGPNKVESFLHESQFVLPHELFIVSYNLKRTK